MESRVIQSNICFLIFLIFFDSNCHLTALKCISAVVSGNIHMYLLVTVTTPLLKEKKNPLRRQKAESRHRSCHVHFSLPSSLISCRGDARATTTHANICHVM